MKLVPNQHELILHINDGSDGTLDYVKKHNIEYTYSDKNIGLCSAINMASKKVTTDYILYVHDERVVAVCNRYCFDVFLN